MYKNDFTDLVFNIIMCCVALVVIAAIVFGAICIISTVHRNNTYDFQVKVTTEDGTQLFLSDGEPSVCARPFVVVDKNTGQTYSFHDEKMTVSVKRVEENGDN